MSNDKYVPASVDEAIEDWSAEIGFSSLMVAAANKHCAAECAKAMAEHEVHLMQSYAPLMDAVSAKARIAALEAQVAAGARGRAVGVPAGWKLVPIDPTDAMALAAVKSSLTSRDINGTSLYATMLAAAPAPAVVQEELEAIHMLKQEIHNLKRHIEDYCPAPTVRKEAKLFTGGIEACPCCPIEVRNLHAVAHNLTVRMPDIYGGDLKRAVDKMQPLMNAHSADRQHSHPEIALSLPYPALPVAAPEPNSGKEARPSDDELWDKTLRDRDQYHKWADKLAEAIGTYFGVYIGEHSNQNLPWSEALDAITSAQPVQQAVALTNEQIIEIADKTKSAESRDGDYILPITFAHAILAVAQGGAQ